MDLKGIKKNKVKLHEEKTIKLIHFAKAKNKSCRLEEYTLVEI